VKKDQKTKKANRKNVPISTTVEQTKKQQLQGSRNVETALNGGAGGDIFCT
jgi:hypothetical protein